MKLLYLPLFIVMWMAPAVNITDPINNVAALIKKGNVAELTKLLAPTVEITILDEDNSYSKDQAEQILTKFFNEHKPASISILHKVNSSASYRFGVLMLTTDKGVFRVAFTLKGAENNLSLIELRFETAKVK